MDLISVLRPAEEKITHIDLCIQLVRYFDKYYDN